MAIFIIDIITEIIMEIIIEIIMEIIMEIIIMAIELCTNQNYQKDLTQHVTFTICKVDVS